MNSLAAFAWADARADFESGRNAFTGGQYERAVEVFAALLAEPSDPKSPDAKKRREIQQAARPLYAASLLALGRGAEADRVILAQLYDDPFYELPVGQFPDPVVQRFAAVARENAKDLDAARQRVVRERQEQLDQEQRERDRAALRPPKAVTTVEHTTVFVRSRVVASVPFGIGQFQNGNVGLGAFFAASEVAGVAASIATHVIAQHYAAANCAVDDCGVARAGFEAARTGNWISVGLTSALVVAGIVEANVAFVGDERRTTRSTSFAPVLELTSGSAFVGLAVSY